MEKAQGVAGFLKAARSDLRLDAERVRSDMDYGVVSVVALDDQPLEESRRGLIPVGARMPPKGWKNEPADVEFEKTLIPGRRIVSTGEPPWMIAPTEGSSRSSSRIGGGPSRSRRTSRRRGT